MEMFETFSPEDLFAWLKKVEVELDKMEDKPNCYHLVKKALSDKWVSVYDLSSIVSGIFNLNQKGPEIFDTIYGYQLKEES